MEENTVQKIEVKEKETIKEKAATFGERHPKLKKVGKGIGLGLGALAVGTLGFFLGKRSSDTIGDSGDVPDIDGFDS